MCARKNGGTTSAAALAIFVVFFCTTPKEQKYVFHCNHLFKNTKSKVQTKIIYKTTLHIKHKTFNAKSTNYRYILNLFFLQFLKHNILTKAQSQIIYVLMPNQLIIIYDINKLHANNYSKAVYHIKGFPHYAK